MTKFQKGKSGNPRGRPTGTAYADRLRAAIQDDLPDILNAIVTKARQGDMTAARMLLDRVIPPLKAKELPVTLSMSGTLTGQGRTIIAEMAKGALSPGEASALLSALSKQAHIAETDELEKRITKLEQQ